MYPTVLVDGEHHRGRARGAGQYGCPWHDERVLLLGGHDVQARKHARAQLVVVFLRLDPHRCRAALGVNRWRDGPHRASKRLGWKRRHLELDGLPLGNLAELAFLDVDHQLERGRYQRHDRCLRTDEGARRGQALRNHAVHRRHNRRVLDAELGEIELGARLIHSRLGRGQVLIGIRILAPVQLRLGLGDRLLLLLYVVVGVRRSGLLDLQARLLDLSALGAYLLVGAGLVRQRDLLRCLVHGRLGLLEVLVGRAGVQLLEASLIALEPLACGGDL